MNPRTLEEMRARYGARHRWLMLYTLMVGTMAAIMSSTVVNVAIPDMSHTFTLGQARAQWVTSGFMVAMTVAMLTTPWLLARYGYRRTYVGAMLLLLAGGMAGGLAQHYPLVLAMRVAEGLAAGVTQPIPAIILLRAFESHEQGRASAVFGTGVVLAPAVGPSIGGLLVDGFGWRSIFFMVVPFCLLAIWLARRYVPVTAPGGGEADRGAALDWRGLALGAAATLCLLNGLVQWQAGDAVSAALLLALAAAGLAGFVVWQRRLAASGRAPLMDLAIFRHRPFALGALVAAIYGTALFGSTYLIPVYLQLGLGLSASYVGGILLPAGLVLAGTIAVTGRLADRVATWKLVSIGQALLALSFALMPLVPAAAPVAALLAISILGRVGLGFILPSLNLGAMRGMDRRLIPQGSSAINFVRMLGGAAGVSLCAIVLEWRLAARGVTLAAAAPGAAPDPARVAAFDEVFLMLAVLCAAALAAAWRMREA